MTVDIQAHGISKYATLVSILIILSCKHLKNSKHKEKFSLTPLICLKTNPEKRNSITINLLPGSFFNQERLTHRRRGD